METASRSRRPEAIMERAIELVLQPYDGDGPPGATTGTPPGTS
jgi:hypothetical protein